MELKTVFLIVLAVVSSVYLVTLFFKFSIFQAVLKGSLLPLILAIYIFGAGRILVLVILALVFGWLGDVLLLKMQDKRFFISGLAGFLTGHICFIIAMFNFTQPLNLSVLIISFTVAAALGFFLFRFVRPANEMKIPVIAYETVIIIMALSALQIFVARGGAFGSFVLAGSLCFLISDSLLAYDTFRRKTKFGYFIIMVTYILAQLFITLGFCTPGI